LAPNAEGVPAAAGEEEPTMGDYAAATLRLYGVSGKQEQILEVLESGWNLEWGVGGALEASDLIEGLELCDTDCSVGWILGGCGTALAALGVTYQFCQEAKYEFDATVEIFTPPLGTFQSSGSQMGEVLVPAAWIERAIDEASALPALREALWRFTGRAWTAALSELAARHPVEAPDE
jgi:hypothetical protein